MPHQEREHLPNRYARRDQPESKRRPFGSLVENLNYSCQSSQSGRQSLQAADNTKSCNFNNGSDAELKMRWLGETTAKFPKMTPPHLKCIKGESFQQFQKIMTPSSSCASFSSLQFTPNGRISSKGKGGLSEVFSPPIELSGARRLKSFNSRMLYGNHKRSSSGSFEEW